MTCKTIILSTPCLDITKRVRSVYTGWGAHWIASMSCCRRGSVSCTPSAQASMSLHRPSMKARACSMARLVASPLRGTAQSEDASTHPKIKNTHSAGTRAARLVNTHGHAVPPEHTPSAIPLDDLSIAGLQIRDLLLPQVQECVRARVALHIPRCSRKQTKLAWIETNTQRVVTRASTCQRTHHHHCKMHDRRASKGGGRG